MENRVWAVLSLLGLGVPLLMSAWLPDSTQAMAIACGLVSLMFLRGQIWKSPETRSGQLMDGARQGLYFVTFLIALNWKDGQPIADMAGSLLGGLVCFGVICGFGVRRSTKPWGPAAALVPALSVLGAMVAVWAATWWLDNATPALALFQALIFGVVISGPSSGAADEMTARLGDDRWLMASVECGILALSIALIIGSDPARPLWPMILAALIPAIAVCGLTLFLTIRRKA